MSEVNFENLLSTGAHFGHVTRKWHPAYEPFILMERNGVHIINLEETLSGLNKAQNFLSKVVKSNGEVLFVGTKKQAKDIVQQEADRCGMFYVVERWLGGTLTNFSTIKKSIKRLQMLEKEGSSIYQDLTKKEIQMLKNSKIFLALGKIAFDACVKFFKHINYVNINNKFKFTHGASYKINKELTLIASYHPSPRNVNTGRLNSKKMIVLLKKIKKKIN